MVIEATQTFSPGNVELLLYLIKKLEYRNIEVKVYLGHEYTYNLLKKQCFKHVNIEMSSGKSTILRFLKKRTNVLYFCSYPPLVKQSKSLVYFHSPFFASPYKFIKIKQLSTSIKVKRILVHHLIKFFHQNVDFFYCQTNQIEQDLKKNFKRIKVKKMPFYNDLDLIGLDHSSKTNFEYDFFYPATPDVHKNYFRLFEAIRFIGKEYKTTLCVTIDHKASEYIDKIKEINQDLKYEAIVNVGRVSKSEVLNLYMKSKAMVFPSLEESLGLPLIESAFISCPIIGSDLPYIYDVVENPIVFNPLNIQDIADKMNDFLEGKYINVHQKNSIENKIDEMIDYLVN